MLLLTAYIEPHPEDKNLKVDVAVKTIGQVWYSDVTAAVDGLFVAAVAKVCGGYMVIWLFPGCFSTKIV